MTTAVTFFPSNTNSTLHTYTPTALESLADIVKMPYYNPPAHLVRQLMPYTPVGGFQSDHAPRPGVFVGRTRSG